MACPEKSKHSGVRDRWLLATSKRVEQCYEVKVRIALTKCCLLFDVEVVGIAASRFYPLYLGS